MLFKCFGTPREDTKPSTESGPGDGTRFSKFISSLCCCRRSGKDRHPEKDPSVQPIANDGDTPRGLDKTPNLENGSKDQDPAVDRHVKAKGRKPSRLSKLISCLRCCCGKAKKSADGQTVESATHQIETGRPSSSATFEAIPSPTDVDGTAHPVSSEGTSPGADLVEEATKEDEAPAGSTPDEDPSKTLRRVRSRLSREEEDLLRKLAMKNQWVRSVSERYRRMILINMVRTSTERKYLGVQEDILKLSRGLFLKEKKSKRKEPRLREQLLRRDWQGRMERAYTEFFQCMPTHNGAHFCLLEAA